MQPETVNERPSWMPSDWTPPKVGNKRGRKKKPPTEVPPTSDDHFSKVVDFDSPIHGDEKAPEQKVTRQLVMNTVVISFGTLATFVDESFAVLDKDHQPLPHVEAAVDEMMPWMEIYGGALTKAMPWVGMLAGLQMLLVRGLDPTMEIIAGVRKPRFARKSPDDIYTDAAKAAYARRAARAESQGQARAAGRTIEMEQEKAA